MIIESAAILGTTAGAVGLTAIGRARHYRRLGAALEAIREQRADHFDDLGRRPTGSFEKSVVAFSDFLSTNQFFDVLRAVERLARPERSYVPAHKKGGTIAYETLIRQAPSITGLYHSIQLRDFVSRIVGAPVQPTPLHDQSSLSILIYERPGDHIGWHYDHNFYRGRHFTLLLPVINSGSTPGGLSHAQLSAKVDGQETPITTAPNTLVLFEGAKVLHKVSPIVEGERRVVISMTYCADVGASAAQAIARRLKDTAFFGVRALWT